MKIERDVMYTQARGCRLCLHIGATAIYFGSRGSGVRIEIATPRRWFRVTRTWDTGEAAVDGRGEALVRANARLGDQLAEARAALEEIHKVLRPKAPKRLTCGAERDGDDHPAGCQGCQYEWDRALEVARAALATAAPDEEPRA